MNKEKLFYILFLFFLISVTSCKEEIELQLSDDKMIHILADLHLAESAILSLNRRLKDSVSQAYYQQIFEIHEVKDSVFYKDLEILRQEPTRVKDMYEKVLLRIDEFGEINSIKKKK